LKVRLPQPHPKTIRQRQPLDKGQKHSNRSLFEKNIEILYEILYFTNTAESQGKPLKKISGQFNKLLTEFHDQGVNLSQKVKKRLLKQKLATGKTEVKFVQYQDFGKFESKFLKTETFADTNSESSARSSKRSPLEVLEKK
jgi:hypothetical protein